MAAVRIKICGITNIDDAISSVEAGADALGFVFWEKSLRAIRVKEAGDIISKLPPFVSTVGVFVNEDPDRINSIVKDAGLSAVQLHGDETPAISTRISAKVIKVFRIRDIRDIIGMRDYRVSAYLLDAFRAGLQGGTGVAFDWNIAVEAKKNGRIILSGGLNPGNVKEAVAIVNPYGVDVSSGVEAMPGKKDHNKVREFIRQVRQS